MFLTKGVLVKLGDFNVSAVVQGHSQLLFTQTGTPYYASPEVWKDRPYDAQSDIWSLGVILYEMACLRLPFQAESMSQLYKVVTKGVYKPLPHHYSKDLC